MRKITEESVKAFFNKENFKSGNTVIEHLKEPHNETTFFYLFGNCIATLCKDELYVTNCGYKTNTTKERLNGILNSLNFYINQKDFKWYINNTLDCSSEEFYNAVINLKTKTINVLNT